MAKIVTAANGRKEDDMPIMDDSDEESGEFDAPKSSIELGPDKSWMK